MVALSRFGPLGPVTTTTNGNAHDGPLSRANAETEVTTDAIGASMTLIVRRTCHAVSMDVAGGPGLMVAAVISLSPTEAEIRKDAELIARLASSHSRR
jgi:hypothetical protein